METLVRIAELLTKFLDQPAFFLGLVALIGLLLQKKNAADTLTGTLRTVVGLLVFQSGAGLLVGGIVPIVDLMRAAFGVEGVYPFNEPAFVVQMGVMAETIVPTFVLAWIIHILIVRLLPQFRCVFLTVHMGLFTSALYNIGLYGAFGLEGVPRIVIAAIFCALYWTITTQWAYRYSKEFVGDQFTLGHHMQLGAIMAAEIGKRFFGKPEEEDADKLELPGVLAIFQDIGVNLAITMSISFFVVGVLAGIPSVQELAGGQDWWLWLILNGLRFSAGVVVLLYGLRQFLAAIVPAFAGWSQRVIPGAIPALDMPVYFPQSPMGTLLGFLGGALGTIVVSVVLLVVRSPLFVFPSLIMAFFEGGAEGVFANKFGGWKAALVAGFVGMVILSVGILWLNPLTVDLQGTGTQFSNIDTNLIQAPIMWIMRFIGQLLGTARPL